MPQTPPRLSSASERRIVEALDDVYGCIENGDSPTDAIYKIASARRIPAGQIKLMVNAVNTGQTNARRLSADDIFTKAAEFPLADAADILSRIYPDNIKTAADIKHSTTVAYEYSRPPQPLPQSTKLVKAASVNIPPLTDKKYEPYPIDPAIAFDKVMITIKKAEAEVKEARFEAAKLHGKCVKIAEDLTEFFCKASNTNFNEVSDNVKELFGTRGEALMNVIGERLPTTVKQASLSLFQPVRMDKEPYKTVRLMLETSRDYFLCKEAYHKKYVETLKLARESLHPFVNRLAQGHSVLEDLCSETSEKSAGMLGSFVGYGLGHLKEQDKSKDILKKLMGSKEDKEYLEKLTDPVHENSIRNIQAEAMLNNLMANDDVIKGHDPNDVLDAYNEISQLAPHGSTQTALMRDLIRKRLSGGPAAIDSFAIDSLVGTNNKLKDRDRIDSGHHGLLQSYGVMPTIPKTASVLTGIE